MTKLKKFGEKSADKQTVFVVEHENTIANENGVLAVFNDLNDAENFIKQMISDDEKFDWDIEYSISQHDIEEGLE